MTSIIYEKQPILGANFLSNFKLLIYMKNKKIIVMTLYGYGSMAAQEDPTQRTIVSKNEYRHILAEFPNVTKPMNFKETLSHSNVSPH